MAQEETARERGTGENAFRGPAKLGLPASTSVDKANQNSLFYL